MSASDVAVEVTRGPFTCLGKEVLANGSHYADAINPHTAEFITDALNHKVSTSDETARLREFYEAATVVMPGGPTVTDEMWRRYVRAYDALQSQEPK